MSINTSRGRRFLPMLMLLSAIILPSCGASPEMMLKSEPSGSAAPPMAAAPEGMAAPADQAKDVDQTQKTQPQLIKKATLNVEVESIEKSIPAVSNIVKQQQGDLLNFQDSKPSESWISHIVSMEIRVPQQHLETTINAIAALGTVKNRTLTAEDVSNQLVDMDARLRNLRKQEELVLKIMERSGKVNEVLETARELGNIREQIERIDAQLKNLQNQVAYSTISLTIQTPGSEAAEQPLGSQLGTTWSNATKAVGGLTLKLLSLGIYLLAFSPYVLLVVGGFFGYKLLKKQKREQ